MKIMNICDDSMKGEIYIRTPYRTYGYYNDPQLNKEKFIVNPFNNDPDDLPGSKPVTLAECSLMVILSIWAGLTGRLKIAGIRLELEEIESEIKQASAGQRSCGN